ncbi:MAG: substrate-binding domain-containing protein [Pseudolabrys sp.]|nr:substrate-binding domain-containing protein [Pseudolabrys sp.]
MKTGLVVATALILGLGAANAADITILSTQATEQSYKELVPQFERATGHKVTTTFDGTLNIKKKITAGEYFDVLIMASPEIEDYLKSGTLAAGSRVDLAKSGVGAGVKAGAPKFDISTVDALKKTLLSAKSIGYSTGPSGLYLLSMIEKLGLTEQVKPKMKQTPSGVFVGNLVANGETEIGFQQISEMSQFAGVDYIGPLPAEVQRYTVFTSGISAGSKQADAARALVKFLTAPEAGAAFRKKGMEPGA